MKRWLVLVGVVLVVAAGLVAFRLRSGGGREGTILGLVGIRDGALLVWQTEDGGWVTRVDPDGGEVWTANLPGRPMTVGGGSPIVLVDDVVTVRYGHGDVRFTDSSAAAFDLDDGHLLWNQVLAPYRPLTSDSRPRLPLHVSGLEVDHMLVALTDNGSTGSMMAIDARTGARRWNVASDEQLTSPVVFLTGLARRGVDRTVLTNLATGAHTEVASGAAGCLYGPYVIPVRTERAEDPWDLVDVEGTLETRTRASPVTALSTVRDVKACGTYLSDFVFLVESGTIDARIHEIVIASRTGAEVRRIALAGSVVNTVSAERPDRSSIGGRLSRFALLVERGPGGEGLTMVDLETGTIAWRAPKHEGNMFELFRAGTHWVVVDAGLSSATIIGFDADTGKLVGAVDAGSPFGLLGGPGVWPGVATPTTLWIYSGDKADPRAAPLAAIDLATMQVRFANTVNVADATARVKAQLGLP